MFQTTRRQPTRYCRGEEEKYMREEASWNPNHQTKKRQQQNVGVEDLMGFNEMNEGEEEKEIQEVPRERQGKVHTLFPPSIPIYASGQSSLMPSLSSSVTGPRLAPGPWSGTQPRQAQGLPSRAGQGAVPQKKRRELFQSSPIYRGAFRALLSQRSKLAFFKISRL